MFMKAGRFIGTSVGTANGAAHQRMRRLIEASSRARRPRRPHRRHAWTDWTAWALSAPEPTPTTSSLPRRPRAQLLAALVQEATQ
ncbi:hypothetical protein GKQ77_02210 [Streptomyces sp. BG9H]|uniref:Uncharacterized protein n=1 Tax=Streptomyces anatolicus TaxID=2675858 RepID=A0ABS6YH31_9ACTN|nr:hypothetical protein [Streptomyces anatolicus]MBW5420384.1 hypothetical protein [Streptomyces anatolicus]